MEEAEEFQQETKIFIAKIQQRERQKTTKEVCRQTRNGSFHSKGDVFRCGECLASARNQLDFAIKRVTRGRAAAPFVFRVHDIEHLLANVRHVDRASGQASQHARIRSCGGSVAHSIARIGVASRNVLAERKRASQHDLIADLAFHQNGCWQRCGGDARNASNVGVDCHGGGRNL